MQHLVNPTNADQMKSCQKLYSLHRNQVMSKLQWSNVHMWSIFISLLTAKVQDLRTIYAVRSWPAFLLWTIRFQFLTITHSKCDYSLTLRVHESS